MEKPSTIQLDAAEKSLRFIYPSLQFKRNQITPQAAAFAFKVIVKVDKGTRISSGLFKLTGVYTSWKSLPQKFVKAIYELFKDPSEFKKNAVSAAYIASPHRRNLQYHLDDPDTFPCPDFRK